MSYVPIAGGILGGFAARRIVAGIVTGIGTLLRSRSGLFVVGAMTWLGLSFGTHKIFTEPTLDMIESHMHTNMGGDLGVTMMQWLGVMRFDEAVSMIVSAYAIRKAAQAGKVILQRRAP